MAHDRIIFRSYAVLFQFKKCLFLYLQIILSFCICINICVQYISHSIIFHIYVILYHLIFECSYFLFQSIEIDTTTQPGTSTSTSSTPLSPRHQPARMSVEIATQTQESFLKEQLTVDPSSCRVCGEDQSDQRRLWVGCSFKNCNFWVHAMCRGIGSKTKSSLSKIKFHCPKHIGSS